MRRCAITLSLMVFLLLPLTAQRGQQSYSLSVDVDLVVLNVRVVGKDGQPLTGLAKEAFHVEEDGKPQNISLFAGEDGPATIGFVLDASASINSKHSDIRNAALRFIQSRHPRDQMFILQFSEKLYWTLPRELQFTDNIALLEQALAWTPDGGRTALYDAVSAAIARAGSGEWDKRAVIVLTDGGDNASKASLPDVLRLAQESNVTIYTIGLFDPLTADADPSVLRKLAQSTGGEVYMPANIEQLAPAWEKISQGIWSQYTIGYTPRQHSFDGKFHKIRVRVDASGFPNVSVHTRPGYRARRSETEP